MQEPRDRDPVSEGHLEHREEAAREGPEVQEDLYGEYGRGRCQGGLYIWGAKLYLVADKWGQH